MLSVGWEPRAPGTRPSGTSPLQPSEARPPDWAPAHLALPSHLGSRALA